MHSVTSPRLWQTSFVYHLQTAIDGAFQSVFQFEFAHYNLADCEVGHFYSHRHPSAPFVNNLVASRILDNEIRSLRNRDYWVIDPPGRHRQSVSEAPTLRSLLADTLGIRISTAESRALFVRLP